MMEFLLSFVKVDTYFKCVEFQREKNSIRRWENIHNL